jgi:predicted dehydrogenase
MSDLRFAMIGAGFWSRFQLAGWGELDGAQCVAVCDRDRARAAALARQCNVATVYDDARVLLARERLDFVDIVTNTEAHGELIQLAAQHELPVICQKPLALSLAEAEAALRTAGQRLLMHENWRWQTPLRALAAALRSERLGQVFRARMQYCSSFPVFDNQPALKDAEQFILLDMGSHLFDAARFLFGEATSLYCQMQRVHRDIRGEDVATVMLHTASGATVTIEMSYASRLEHERFPETYVTVEAERGSLELGPDFWVRETTAAGTCARRHQPPRYAWADPAYDLVQASIVDCHADLLAALQGKKTAETTGADNLKTMRLVFAAYESARSGQVIQLSRAKEIRQDGQDLQD